MAQHVSERQPSDRASEPRHSAGPPSGWVTGAVVFAGVMMVMVGVFHVLAGLAAIVDDEFYVAAPNYVYDLDVTGWGWIHLIAGVIIAAAGVAVWSGQLWARLVGIWLASLSLIANFLFIPYYPVWSMLMIAIDVLVIYALAVAGRRPVL